MTKPNIIHLGGEHTVTGSCHLLRTNGLNIMVDCGLAQGNDAIERNDLLCAICADGVDLFVIKLGS